MAEAAISKKAEAYVRLSRLTAAQIRNTIGESAEENGTLNLESETDVVNDVCSDSESDYESIYESEPDDADFDGNSDDDHENAETVEYIGRDGTEWYSSPHPRSKSLRAPNKSALNKVNLRSG